MNTLPDVPHVPVFPRTIEQAHRLLIGAHYTPERVERAHMIAYLKATDRAQTPEHYDRIYCATVYALAIG